MTKNKKQISLNLNGTWNDRDIATTTGITKGVVLRAASLSKLTDSGQKKLLELDVTDVIDLRSEREVSKDGADQLPKDIILHNLPIQTGDPSNFFSALGDNIGANIKSFVTNSKIESLSKTYMSNMYKKMVTTPANMKTFGDALRIIANAKGATLVHCTAGKDRTGVLLAILLRLRGISDDIILKDYLYSNNFIDDLKNHIGTSEGGIKVINSLLEVHPEYLKTALKEIDNNYSNIKDFVREAGLSDFEMQKLINKL